MSPAMRFRRSHGFGFRAKATKEAKDDPSQHITEGFTTRLELHRQDDPCV